VAVRIAILAAGLLLWMQLSQPLGAQAPDSQPPPAGILGGTVTDAGNGEPLGKVTLTLSREGQGQRARPRSAKTGLEGKFLFENLEPGRYRLRAERNRYVASEYGQRAPNQQGTPLTLQAGQKLTGLTMQLQRAAVISGRVLDEDNEPVAGARVAAMAARYMQGEQRFFPVGADQTDDRGEYRIFGLAPGEYFVSVSQSNRGRAVRLGPPSTLQEEDETYVETYFPGTTEMEQAVALKVAASQELLGVDVQLRPTRTFRVTGRVVSETGDPLEGRNVTLTLLPRETRSVNFNSMNRSSTRSPQGDFTMQGVTPGSYTLLAQVFDRRGFSGPNASSGMLSGRLAVDVGNRNVEGLSVPVRPGLRIEGRLQAEGSAEIDLSNVRISLRSQEPMLAMGGGGTSDRVNEEDGTFTLEAVTQGVYEVMLGGVSEDAYLKAARLGNQEVLSAGLDLTNSSAAGVLDLTLSTKGGRLDGAVVNAEGQPVVGAQVVLLPEASRRQRVGLFKSATTDQNGVFTLRGIAPGNYSIVALENVERGAWMDPNFLRGNENAAKKVEIKEGSAQSFELKVLSLGASR
jgi:protocatechuate 3,4-dioxygenase beta subunit